MRLDPQSPDDDVLRAWLEVALDQARAGLAEGGVPIGATLIGRDGDVLGRGRNRRVQDGDPSVHAETAAFKDAGRQRSYRGTTMVTTLSPCWYCSGLVRQFGISRLLIGEAVTFSGGHTWLAEHGVEVIIRDDAACVVLMERFIADNPALWMEDIGDDSEL
ncbi:nucleoside deaminase [Phytoactinopolyspora endophytica]|uniref:nucleoside deaminase n=1 Tax=Phytoactinopolyspora endophytica TaxID=1642495 RepID=UPI00197B2C58|nr:nucleoside deaminase [Phytoactinopolyspora endophytica]